MAYNFLPTDRDQALLMPPDLREWLPPEHLVWFVIDSVTQIDLQAFLARYRADGWGRAAYDPAMMVTLLLYAYATGVRSARQIERRCSEDVAFRVITANQVVDHATICRFRTIHREALGELFVSVLGLCGEAGLVHPEVVAIDGTKIAANASQRRNLTREQLEDYARKVFEEAERIDAQEDQRYGERLGHEIPEHLVDQANRIQWLRERLKQTETEKAEHDRRRKERDAEAGRPPRHRKIPKATVNTTDPDSRVQRTPTGFQQGYNGQVMVTTDQVIVAADLVADNTDNAQLEPMLAQAHANLAEAQPEASIGTVVADAGYFSEDNVVLDVGPELLIAPVNSRGLAEAVTARTEPAVRNPRALKRWEVERALSTRRAARRAEIMQAYIDHLVTAAEAAEALGLTVQRIYMLKWWMTKRGHLPEAQPAQRPPRPQSRQVMLERFARPGALETYKLRAQTVEPVFGQLKEARGLRRMLHRGLGACRTEFRMMAAAHNLRKMWTLKGPFSRFALAAT